MYQPGGKAMPETVSTGAELFLRVVLPNGPDVESRWHAPSRSTIELDREAIVSMHDCFELIVFAVLGAVSKALLSPRHSL